MARPIKVGLEYFPLDVDVFSDDKIRFVASRFQEKGELLSIKLLCKIYKEGYFIIWGDDEALLFADAAGKNITYGLVNDVVNELLKRGFFSRTMYMRFSILTSNGIQKRYERIKKDAGSRCEIDERYRITELTDRETIVTGEETPGLLGNNATKESKEQERTGNKSKENPEGKPSGGGKPPPKRFDEEDKVLMKAFAELKIPNDTTTAWVLVKEWIFSKKPQFIEPYVCAWNIFAAVYKLPSVKTINQHRKKKFQVRIREQAFNFFEILAIAKKSDYLKSSTWFGFDWIFENEMNYTKILEGNYK